MNDEKPAADAVGTDTGLTPIVKLTPTKGEERRQWWGVAIGGLLGGIGLAVFAASFWTW